MSINDLVYPVYNNKREMWKLLRGRETFYDDDRVLREWETKQEALDWAYANLNVEFITENDLE